MNENLQKRLTDLLGVFTLFLMVSSAFLLIQIFKGGVKSQNYDTLTVDASAEIFAIPDIAEISFSVRSENREMSIAQSSVENVVSESLNSLKNIGILEKDIKTTFYSANPRYEYRGVACTEFRCPEGERVLVGYEVNQSIMITIRDLDRVGEVIALLGSSRVSDIFGPNFRIENEDDLKAQAREEAIQKAREKARSLAKSLGVRIVGIENFSEGGYGGVYFTKNEMARSEDIMTAVPAFTPTLPVGENKIISNVNITYRVK